LLGSSTSDTNREWAKRRALKDSVETRGDPVHLISLGALSMALLLTVIGHLNHD
jgi:hypothetical protein